MFDRELTLVNKNLRFLRKEYGYTQSEFAQKIGVKRPSIGAYEENRAEPKIATLRVIAEKFNVTLEELINSDLELQSKNRGTVRGKDISANRLRILSVTVNSENEENIEFVPQKAAAGYTNGFSDTEYLSNLPRLNLPMASYGTHRAFEINGDSMLPIESGSIIIGKYVEDWLQIRDNQTYVVVTKTEGLVYKRVQNLIQDKKELLLQSDNKNYSAYCARIEDILEVWEAKYLLTNLR